MPPPRGFLNETLPGEPPPSWMEAALPAPPERPALARDLSVDVAIVGAGYAGLSAALHLAEQGARVAVVEAHRVGWGASGRNGGQLDTLPRREVGFFEETLGRDDARKIVDLAREAAGMVRRRIARHGVACDLTDGLVFANHSAALDGPLEAEVEALRREYGVDGVAYLPPERLRDWVVGDGYSGGSVDHAGGALNPLAYARGLATAAEAAGAAIYERTRVVRIDAGRVSWSDPAGVHAKMRARLVTETAQGQEVVTADRILLCLGGLHDGLERDYAARVAPLLSFQIATEPLGEALREILPGGAPVADSRFVLNYFRPTPDGRLVFGGGESSGLRPPRDIAAVVRRRLLRVFPAARFPKVAGARIDHAWSGTLGLSRHRAPLFRKPAPRVLAIGGWSGAGIHMATLGGAVAAEAVLGAPARFDLLARVPAPAFPARGRLRRPLLALALAWHSLRER